MKGKAIKIALGIPVTLAISSAILYTLYGFAAKWPSKLNPITKLNDIDKYIIEVLGKEPTKYNRMEEVAKSWDQLLYIMGLAAAVSLIAICIVGYLSSQVIREIKSEKSEVGNRISDIDVGSASQRFVDNKNNDMPLT